MTFIVAPKAMKNRAIRNIVKEVEKAEIIPAQKATNPEIIITGFLPNLRE